MVKYVNVQQLKKNALKKAEIFMAYSELIKNLNRVREYMRDFYIYGFRTRSEYTHKSARSFDNERRRIESWLGRFISYREDQEGRHVFLSADSRTIPSNPLYQAYKSKSFTANDITLHFLIMDLLCGGVSLTAAQMLRRIEDCFAQMPDTDWFPEEATLRRKLKEYTSCGLLKSSREGRNVLYCRNTPSADTLSLSGALYFASEADPVGVIGSFLLDRSPDHRVYENMNLRFKHHYLLNAFDQDILCQLMQARRQKRIVQISMLSPLKERLKGSSRETLHKVYPLRFLCSTQNGRRYLLAHEYGAAGSCVFRLDRILRIRLLEEERKPEPLEEDAEKLTAHMWGASIGNGKMDRLDHIEMVVSAEKKEKYVRDRLFRERRCGSVLPLDDHKVLFTADVCDAMELLPWVRTFTGRIISFTCTNEAVTKRFYEDLETLRLLYLPEK